MHALHTSAGIQTNVVPNKTHEVLWVVPGGPCLSVNRRMHYAKELGQHIGLDIVGHCLEKKKEEEEGGKAGGWQTLHLEWSSHPGGRGSGIPKDYKYQLALEEISCVDFVTNVYFGVAERMETVPIGKEEPDPQQLLSIWTGGRQGPDAAGLLMP